MPSSVFSILKKTSLENLALASNINYGRAIYERGGVEIVKMDEHEVEAWAGGLKGDVRSGGGSKRHVWLRVKDDKIVSRCTGNPKNHDIFCKHCVAVSLKVLSK